MSINVIFCLWNSDAVEKVKEKYITFGAKEKMGCAALGNFMCPREMRRSFQSICMDSLWEQPLY